MVVPITVAERVVAVLRLASYHRAEAFNDQQFFMVSELAASASGPLANALRYERKTKEAITDGLTGLLNHREFRHRVELEFSRFRRRGTAFSVMLIDIDLFKSVNDSMGHTHGDEVLKSAADLVRRAVRDHDLVARYGGDELAVLLPETGPDQARSAAERLVAAVHRAGIPATPTHPLTFSIGTATCPVDGITIDEVVMAADQALYFAKRAGRDTSMTASEIARRYVDDSRGLLDALSESGPQMIVAIARAVDAADPAGPGHASRIAAVADAIVRRLGRPEGELELVRSAALLHEAGRLAETHGLVDWRAEHPALAEEILRRGRFLPELVTLVRHHHERWDGHGGPDGLAGEEIPMLARVLAVSERYEELTTAGAGSLEALDRITEDAGHAYDPAVVEALAALVGEGDRLGAVLRAAAPPVRVVETLSKA
jgi:diguanylate cyclase (GGDEF)-like protein